MAYYQSAAMEVDGEFLSCAHPPGSALCLPHGGTVKDIADCNTKVSTGISVDEQQRGVTRYRKPGTLGSEMYP